MIRFAEACDAIAATASKREKIERLAAYLRDLDRADVAAAARFFTANPFGAREQRTLSVGGRTIVAAARAVWGVAPGELSAAYRASGDIGDALGRFIRPPALLGLFAETLTPARLKMVLDEIADARGPSAARRRTVLCERILAACSTEREARYVIRLLAGELRIGLREALVVDAIAAAFQRPLGDVRRAVMAAGDIGDVALAARDDTLSALGIRYGIPVAFMLASPIPYGVPYRDVATGTWIAEDKYDGIRAQAHRNGAGVQLFSRTFSDIGPSFPAVVRALAHGHGNFIVDGEIVARRDDAVLPFRYLQTRLQRKDPSPELMDEIPVTFVVFDVLAHGEALLLDAPLHERRTLLPSIVASHDRIAIAPWSRLGEHPNDEIVNTAFADARRRGNEGLMLKRADSPYAPGRRGKWWLKLKRELSTLDVVVVAVEWGHGKRHRVLSDYTFAVREAAERPRLLTLGKAYSGLTDAEIAEMTEWFLAHRLPASAQRSNARASEIPVEPKVVLEVAFDIIQRSTLHESGYALRFPRIVRLRSDKTVGDIDTLGDVERVYQEMLAREGVTT